MITRYRITVNPPGYLPDSDAYPYLTEAPFDAIADEIARSFDASPGDTPERDARDTADALADARKTIEQFGAWDYELPDGLNLSVEGFGL